MVKEEDYSWLLKCLNILHSKMQEHPYIKKNLHQLKKKPNKAKIHDPDFISV